MVLRLRRLIGTTPKSIQFGRDIAVGLASNQVYVSNGDDLTQVNEIQGMKFEIFRELATAWYRSPGELVLFSRLERYSEGEDAPGLPSRADTGDQGRPRTGTGGPVWAHRPYRQRDSQALALNNAWPRIDRWRPPLRRTAPQLNWSPCGPVHAT